RGEVTVGTSVSDSSAVLTNTGTQALSVAVSISGTDPGDFSVTQCPSPLAAETPCNITVTFRPTQAGVRSATLVVSYPGAAAAQTVQLTGDGIATQSAVNLAPSMLAFPATTTGSVSASQSIVLTNSGHANLNISSIVVGGPNSADFSITNTP